MILRDSSSDSRGKLVNDIIALPFLMWVGARRETADIVRPLSFGKWADIAPCMDWPLYWSVIFCVFSILWQAWFVLIVNGCDNFKGLLRNREPKQYTEACDPTITLAVVYVKAGNAMLRADVLYELPHCAQSFMGTRGQTKGLSPGRIRKVGVVKHQLGTNCSAAQ